MIQVRYQFWMRELARVVSSVGPEPKWAFAADLKSEELRLSAAVVHCRECGLTGWAGTSKHHYTAKSGNRRARVALRCLNARKTVGPNYGTWRGKSIPRGDRGDSSLSSTDRGSCWHDGA
jgi:hypothetical protein